jgi:serine/threonine protein kinase
MDWEEDLLRYGAFDAGSRALKSNASEQRRGLSASRVLGDPRRSQPEAPERSRDDAYRDFGPAALLEHGSASGGPPESRQVPAPQPLENRALCAQFAQELAFYPAGPNDELEAVATRQALQIANCACESVQPFLVSALRSREEAHESLTSANHHVVTADDIIVNLGSLYIAFRFSLIESATNAIGHRSIATVSEFFLKLMLQTLQTPPENPSARSILEAWSALEVCCMLHFRERFACSFGDVSGETLFSRAEMLTASKMRALAVRVVEHSMRASSVSGDLEARADYLKTLADEHLYTLPKLNALTIDSDSLLGEGGHGQVTLRRGSMDVFSGYDQIDVEDEALYAAKRVPLYGGGDCRLKTRGSFVYFAALDVILENLVWRRITSAEGIAPHFVPLKGVFLENNMLTFLSPAMLSLEPLYVNAINCKEHGWSDDALRCFTAHLFQGLRVLHALSFVHGDIKPANLLLDSRAGVLKINDFGLARPWMQNDQLGEPMSKNHFTDADMNRAGTNAYQAPELQLLADRGVMFTSSKIDVWAAGTCVIYFATGHHYWTAMGGTPLANMAFNFRSEGRLNLRNLAWAVQMGGMPPPESMVLKSRTWAMNSGELPTETPSGLASALEWGPRNLSSQVGLSELLAGALAPTPERRVSAFELCAASYVGKALDRLPQPFFYPNGDPKDPSHGDLESFEQIDYDLGPVL